MTSQPKALMIQPPIFDFALFDLFMKPLGLLRIGAWLKSCGWQVEYLNCLDFNDGPSSRVLGSPQRRKNGSGKFYRQVVPKPDPMKNISRRFARYGILRESVIDRLQTIARSGPPDIVCIATGMTYWYPGVLETADLVRSVFPKVSILAGGIYASLLPEHLRQAADIDYVIQGDGLEELRHTLTGLRFPVSADGPPLFPDSDALFLFGDAGVLQLNRGCPLSCTYCASRLISPGFTQGDPAAALDSFELLWKGGIKNYAFYDDALLCRKGEVFHPFLQGIIDQGYTPAFYTPNAVHLRYMDYETAALMKRAGFREVRLGFESAGEEFHSTYDSKFDLHDFQERVASMKKAGFSGSEIRVYVLAGLPGQYAEAVESSIRYAHESGVRTMLARYSPVPGTALWERSVAASRYPIDEDPLFQNNTFFSMEWEKFTRSDLQRLQDLTVELNNTLT